MMKAKRSAMSFTNSLTVMTFEGNAINFGETPSFVSSLTELGRRDVMTVLGKVAEVSKMAAVALIGRAEVVFEAKAVEPCKSGVLVVFCVALPA